MIIQGQLALLGCNSCFLCISDSGDAMCVRKTAGDDEMITVVLKNRFLHQT